MPRIYHYYQPKNFFIFIVFEPRIIECNCRDSGNLQFSNYKQTGKTIMQALLKKIIVFKTQKKKNLKDGIVKIFNIFFFGDIPDVFVEKRIKICIY
jgi:hypothetical protein